MSGGGLMLFALASAAVVANAYYIHPIISLVADYFGVSDAMIGMVPSFNQIALALGIFLLLPLGDWFSNRTLVLIFVCGQVLSIIMMALASSFAMFVASSTVLGFFTIAPYILPAYVSKRVPVTRLGYANSILTTGIIFGILIARAGAGVVGEHFGWRAVYIIAACFMVAVSALLFLIMEKRDDHASQANERNYFALIFSILPIIRKYPEIILTGTIQALGFGIFLAIWMGLGLHLTTPEMGFGTDTVGYLALLTVLNLFFQPYLGRWSDRIGPRRARLIVGFVQFCGVVLLSLTGQSLWLMILPILMINLVGPTVDVANRMTFLSEAPEFRTRLMTVYIIFMFLGGGLASWAGTAVYDFAGWFGTACLICAASACQVTLSIIGYRWKGN